MIIFRLIEPEISKYITFIAKPTLKIEYTMSEYALCNTILVYFPNHITLTTIMRIELITKFQFKWANTYNMLNRYDTFY